MFENVMPTIDVYWGDTFKVVPRVNQDPPEACRRPSASHRGLRRRRDRLPVPTELGRHIIETLMERDFDPAHSRYMQEEYGGTIGPAAGTSTISARPSRAKPGHRPCVYFPDPALV